jgi:DNA-binding CsgD family transcriptional regulator
VVLAGLARVEAHWLEGQLDPATDELARVVRLASRADLRQRCWLALWRHRLTGAIGTDLAPITIEPFASQVGGHGASAAEVWDRLGYRHEAAVALLDTREEAALRESLSRLTDLGAPAAARLVRRSMRDLGVRSIPTGARPTTRAHPRGLTAREQEVLRLVCQGHTNDQISEHLFISVKTVDHHVSAVLAKLGVASRRAATTEARRLGLVTPANLGSSVGGYG